MSCVVMNQKHSTVVHASADGCNMSANDTSKRIRYNIELRVGKLKSLEIYSDPVDAQLHAVQCLTTDGENAQFLVDCSQVPAQCDEAWFTTWPPTWIDEDHTSPHTP